MQNKNHQTPTSIEWVFDSLYSRAFIYKIITPLLLVFITYYLGLFLDLKDMQHTPTVSLVLGAISYLLLVFWLTRTNFMIWRADIQQDKESVKRIFPFIKMNDRKYLILLGLNMVLAVIIMIIGVRIGITAHLGILFLVLLNRFIAITLNDFYKSIRYHLSYFYPSILSIVILAFVIAKQEQFGDFFLELARGPWNFMGFALIFGVSIITVWFAPSYLFFTDHFTLDEDKSKEVSHYFKIWQKGLLSILSFIAVSSRVVPMIFHSFYRLFSKNAMESDLMNLLWKHKNEINNRVTYQMEPKGFTITRILLGLCYIATLASLAGNVWLKSYGIQWQAMNSAILLLALILPLTVSYFYFYTYEKIKASNLDRFRDLLQYSWVGLALIFTALTTVLLVLTILNKTNYQDSRLFLALLLFIITTIFTSLPLICYGYTFQRLYYFLASVKVPGLSPLKKYARYFTAIILGANASVAGLSLLILVVLLLVPYEKAYPFISHVNTVNIYILLVNGLIAGITLVDRFTRIRSKVHKMYHNDAAGISIAARSWAIILVIVLPVMMILRGQGNTYHEVPYTTNTPTEELTLEDYTADFIDNLQKKDTTSPIILIAADGGGLKAATWTMLNLRKLDKMDLYEDNVFLMAGASGGSLGQGLYTYMKAQDFDETQIQNIIDILGNSNFVSGDLTGVMTRWPYNFIPQIKGWKWPGSTQDRMEAMAETYFDIIQKENGQPTQSSNPWSYSALREVPYNALWTQRDKNEVPHLPVFITNSARAEDGVKAWSHPFKPTSFIGAGAVDLSSYQLTGKPTSYISFPDALFLTNRFPIMSPAAKIKGKGHFIDAGAVDNSGLETLIQFLTKMKAEAEGGTEQFEAFFKEVERRGIKVISIRNARGRYIEDLYTAQISSALEKTNRKSELSAFFGAVVSAGIYGKPKVIDEIVYTGEGQKLFSIRDFLTIDIPFRLAPAMVENHFFREIEKNTFEEIKEDIVRGNQEIDEVYGRPQVVEPALGRLLSKPSQEYMKRMLDHPFLVDQYKKLSINNETPSN